MPKSSWTYLLSMFGSRFACLSALIVVCGLSGCSTFGLNTANQMTEIPTNATNLYRVEMHANNGEPTIHDGVITALSDGSPFTVQSALEDSGAIDRFKRMEINVYRKVEGSSRGLKMPVTYEPGRDAVRVDQDYALHPGDRIIVKPIKQSILSVIQGGLTGN